MEKRIQMLEEIVFGKVDEASYEGDLKEAKLRGGLKNRMNELEAKIT